MKKRVNLLLIIFLVMSATVSACPHSDKNGLSHFQFYNESYTVMSMLYPRENHLYNKDIPIDIDDEDFFKYEDKILSEAFGFPLVQDKETYWQNYWFTDENLQKENWEEKEWKTTVEGIKEINVSGENYKLIVGVQNTFNAAKKYIDRYTSQMYYNIRVKTIDINSDDDKSKSIKKVIEENDLDLISNQILEVKADINITDSYENDYKSQNIDVNEFYDNIVINLRDSSFNKNFKVVNLKKTLTEDNNLKADYINESQVYSFNINKPGIYAVVDSQFEIKDKSKISETDVIKEDEVKKVTKNNNNTDEKETNLMNSSKSYFVIGFFLLIIAIITILLMRKSKKITEINFYK